ELSTPPPRAKAHWSNGTDPHGVGPGKVALGAARLPLMTLSPLASGARVALPAASGGMATPPPAATPVESFSPPVIVTRLIETVGLLTPSPTVTSGPPPRVTLDARRAR